LPQPPSTSSSPAAAPPDARATRAGSTEIVSDRNYPKRVMTGRENNTNHATELR
jgi:hypothetical protein